MKYATACTYTISYPFQNLYLGDRNTPTVKVNFSQ